MPLSVKETDLTSTPRQCLGDVLLGRLFKNAGVLFCGNMVASMLGLASLALTARALGVEQFGILVLITTYAVVVDRLVNFQSWQALIKYGAESLEKKNYEDFRSLVKFGFILDATSAVLGTIIAVCAAWFFGQWRGWDEHLIIMVCLYSLTILFHIRGTPTAILRLYGRFSRIACQNIIAYSLLLLGVSIAFVLGAGLWLFLLAWAMADILGKLVIIYFGFVELARQEIVNVFSSSIKNIRQKFNGIWGFVWATNINSSLRSSIREVDILIIGVLLGPAGAGLFKIVKSAALILGKIADPLYEAIYPETARLITGGRYVQFKSYALRASIISGGAALLFLAGAAISGEWVIMVVLGNEYLDAYAPMLVYIVAYVVWMFAYPLSATILSFGMPYVNLGILAASLLIYFPALIYLVGAWGLIGASVATVIFYLFWAICMLGIVMSEYRKRIKFAGFND